MTVSDRGLLVERVAEVLQDALSYYVEGRAPAYWPEETKTIADLVVDVVEAEMRRQHGDRVSEGMARVRAAGKRTGRPALLTEDEIERLMDIMADYTYAELAEMYFVSPSTIGRIIRERGP